MDARRKRTAKPAYEKRHLVDIVDGRGLYHEDGFLVLEDYPFRQGAVWGWIDGLVGILILPLSIFAVMEVFHHPVIKEARGWIAFLLIFNRLCTWRGDTILLETKGLDIYFGSVRVGRPKYVRYDFGWSLWGYTMFMYDDDATARPRRVFFASLRRDSVRRVAAAVDRYLARDGEAPDPDPTVWPPAPLGAQNAAGEAIRSPP